MLGLASHPIAQVEHRYQTWSMGQRTGCRFRVGRLMYRAMLATALIFYLSQLFGALLGIDAHPIVRALPLPLAVLGIYMFFSQIMLIFIAVVRGANSIARERQSGTWEILTLTCVTPYQIIWSKWWGVVCSMLRPAMMLVPLKAAVAVVVGVEATHNTYYIAYDSAQLIPPNPLGIMLVVPLTVAFTLAAVGLAVAVGVMLSPLVRRPAVALASSLTVYCLMAIVGFAMIALIGFMLNSHYTRTRDSDYNRLFTLGNTVAYTGLTWFENGILLSSRLVSYSYHFPSSESSLYSTPNYISDEYRRSVASFFLALIFSLGIYPPLIWLVLRIGQSFAWRQGALPSA